MLSVVHYYFLKQVFHSISIENNSDIEFEKLCPAYSFFSSVVADPTRFISVSVQMYVCMYIYTTVKHLHFLELAYADVIKTRSKIHFIHTWVFITGVPATTVHIIYISLLLNTPLCSLNTSIIKLGAM